MRKIKILVLSFVILLSSCISGNKKDYSKGKTSIKLNNSIITDIDGNSYKTININGTVWFQENLRVTHYNNGDPINNFKKDSEWNSTEEGAYSAYNNDLSTINKIGLLYNLFAVIDKRKICPKGFHIANEYDWSSIATDRWLSAIQPSVLNNPLFNHNIIGWRRSADDDYSTENEDSEYNSFQLETVFNDGTTPYWMDGFYWYDDENVNDSIKRGNVMESGGEYYWGYKNDGYACRCVENK